MPAESRPSRAERGAVQYAILALLVPHPRHGYDLRDAFEAALGGNWPLNSGQIYSSLDRLGRDGLVAEAGTERGGGPDKRLWTLTDAGRDEVAAWFAAAVPRDYRLRDELYLKLILAVVTSAARPGPVLQIQRRQLFRELHGLTARRNALDPRRELAQILLLDSAVMHAEAELRWLDVVEARLDDVRAQPLPARPIRQRGRQHRRFNPTVPDPPSDERPPSTRVHRASREHDNPSSPTAIRECADAHE
jgi:DNA-binding PadR family transcriptional regulator